MYIDTLGTTHPKASTETSSGDALGKDAFLTLLVAQMENQDPLNPMEGSEFTAQLAQYSSLEQLYNVNDNLELINDGQSGMSSYYALDFMGKEIYVDGNSLTMKQGADVSGGFSINYPGSCTVNILDSNGQQVKSLSLGNLEAGTHGFDWDGLGENGNTLTGGDYTFEVTAVGNDGKSLSAETYTMGKVDRVSLAGDMPMLYVGSTAVAVSEVKDIRLSQDT